MLLAKGLCHIREAADGEAMDARATVRTFQSSVSMACAKLGQLRGRIRIQSRLIAGQVLPVPRKIPRVPNNVCTVVEPDSDVVVNEGQVKFGAIRLQSRSASARCVSGASATSPSLALRNSSRVSDFASDIGSRARSLNSAHRRNATYRADSRRPSETRPLGCTAMSEPLVRIVGAFNIPRRCADRFNSSHQGLLPFSSVT